MQSLLVLEDGFSCVGRSFAGKGEVFGELVFNTGLTGYQEVITDPSYTGQIVLMTATMVGNYGIRHREDESLRICAEGFVVKEYSGDDLSVTVKSGPADHLAGLTHPCHDSSDVPGKFDAVHNRVVGSLADYLCGQHVLGVEGMDTRELTRHIRDKGAMRCGISTETLDSEELLAKVRASETMEGRNLVRDVTTTEPYLFCEGEGCRVVVMDYGVKVSTLQHLALRGCRVEVMPAYATRADILATRPDGLMLSNGPGDPRTLPEIVGVVESLVGELPLFGICLGHQIIGQALGSAIFKLPFGHHGSNHPVRDERSKRVYITTQNHGFAVDPELLDPDETEVSFLNLNDRTNEGVRHRKHPLFSVQFHPEAAPGPHDTLGLFDDFINLMGGR